MAVPQPTSCMKSDSLHTMQMTRTAAVAFSGGLDTSCIVSWLKEEWYGFDEVVAVLVDVGQEFDLEASIERACCGGR